MEAKKFLVLFCLFTVMGLAGISLFNYVIDPFFQYRVKDGQYILNPRFVNPGLLKNYDYDMLLIGSSMTQLMDIPAIGEGLGGKLLRTSSGDMNLRETLLLYSLARKDKVKKFIINIDLLTFNSEQDDMRYSEYLYKTDILNRIKYLISYESCRIAPVDVYMSNYILKKHGMTPKMANRMMIDKIGDYSLEIVLNKDYVISDYDHYMHHHVENVSYEKMAKRFDEFVGSLGIDKNKDKEYIFFLPPYSALYWQAAKEKGYYEDLRRFVKYILDKTNKNTNLRFVCMYDANFITQLDTYSDMIHYAPSRRRSITDAIVGRERNYGLTSDNVDVRFLKLETLLEEFNKTDWRN